MSEQQNFMNIVEAALLAAGRPLDTGELLALFEGESERPDRKNLREIIAQLQEDWAERSLELIEVASGYRFQVKADYARWMGRLWAERPPRYSRALMETLALIAYRQPVTRAEIEDVRGVAVSPNIIKTLLEREWIRVLGHRDVPGRPALFGTTKDFLDALGLKSLEDLPPLSEIRDIENLHADLFGGLEAQSAPSELVAAGEAGDVQVAGSVQPGAVSGTVAAVAEDLGPDAVDGTTHADGGPNAGTPDGADDSSPQEAAASGNESDLAPPHGAVH